ncbi:rhizopuspepsin 2 precursor [Linnemannia elongata]|nr:rhizopuspepsin 2 precursor [Linnemannia elongata]
MKVTALVVSLAVAVLAVVDASPLKISPKHGHAVPLTRNPNYKHNTKAQIAKLNKRYPGVNILATGTVPLVNVHPDLEYYGTVSVGTPAQNVKLDFDTGSSDIWFPSSTCTTTACKKHVRFNSAASSTFQKDGRKWNIGYGDGSTASGILGSDIVSVGGVQVRQTIGLATAESSQFGSSPEDGLFGLGFNTIESVSGVKTFMDNAIAAGALTSPVVSVFLPSVRRNGGVGGQYLFGGIDSTKYTGSLTYVPVTQKGYWQIHISDASVNGVSLGQASEGIIDTGTTLVIVGDAAAQAIHKKISGAINDPNNGWLVPCSLKTNTGNVGFKMGGKTFNVPLADLAYEDLGDGSGNCFSGVQGGQDGLWILGDVFIKNNYCVFSQTSSPSIGIAPLAY